MVYKLMKFEEGARCPLPLYLSAPSTSCKVAVVGAFLEQRKMIPSAMRERVCVSDDISDQSYQASLEFYMREK